MPSEIRSEVKGWACGLASLLAAMGPCASLAVEAAPSVTSQAITVKVAPRWAEPGKPFEGWGTALAWFANVTGKLPPAQREQLADLLYGPDGLKFNIARYNIGGGNAPETETYLRLGADIPGRCHRYGLVESR